MEFKDHNDRCPTCTPNSGQTTHSANPLRTACDSLNAKTVASSLRDCVWLSATLQLEQKVANILGPSQQKEQTIRPNSSLTEISKR